MELRMSPVAERTRQAPLALLDAEHHEWKDELEFCQDELAFFYTILRRGASRKTYPGKELAELQKALFALMSDSPDYLKQLLQIHQDVQAALSRTDDEDGKENYRQMHRILKSKVQSFQENIRAFKKELFAFIRKYDGI